MSEFRSPCNWYSTAIGSSAFEGRGLPTGQLAQNLMTVSFLQCFPQPYTLFVAAFPHPHIYIMQIHSLPAGGTFRGEIEVSPVMLYTKQRSAHRCCFIRHYMQDKKHPHRILIFKHAVLMFIQRNQSLLENQFVAVSFDIVAVCHK